MNRPALILENHILSTSARLERIQLKNGLDFITVPFGLYFKTIPISNKAKWVRARKIEIFRKLPRC